MDAKFKSLVLVLVMAMFTFLVPNDAKGSENMQISLLTCEPGEELYSAFGHSALRVYYEESGRDIVFNFGLFDFNTPNFYSKFIRGSLKYMLGIQYTEDFIYQYRREGRAVYEQILNLTDAQKSDLIARLEYLYLPQNRYYYYSFLYKNCTTELRDLIFEMTEGAKEDYKGDIMKVTFRQQINEYMKGWPGFGVNLILGSSLDRPVDSFEYMFLPDNLYDGLAILKSEDGIPLVGGEETLVNAQHGLGEGRGIIGFFLSPFFGVLFLFAILLLSLFKRRLFDVLSGIYIVFCSLTGILLLIIISITEHTELYANYNLLWANPFFLFVLFASVKGWKKTERLLSAISLIFLALLQYVWATGLQSFNPEFFIIVLSLALLFIVRVGKQKSFCSRL